MISVIVPALNEELLIEGALTRVLAMEGDFEVIVVDNGSSDRTGSIAARWAKTITSPPGRGPAMNAGAACSKGDILLFLHVDTRLPSGAFPAIEEVLGDSGVVGGCFSIAFEPDDWRSRLVASLYGLFSRAGFFYGDSAIFVRRSTFESLNGFKPLPLMEDFDLCLRLRKMGRTARLPLRVVSSARRWQKQGFLRMVLIYLTIQGIYLLGFRNPSIFKLYKAIR